jgi:hypothetical protein
VCLFDHPPASAIAGQRCLRGLFLAGRFLMNRIATRFQRLVYRRVVVTVVSVQVLLLAAVYRPGRVPAWPRPAACRVCWPLPPTRLKLAPESSQSLLTDVLPGSGLSRASRHNTTNASLIRNLSAVHGVLVQVRLLTADRCDELQVVVRSRHRPRATHAATERRAHDDDHLTGRCRRGGDRHGNRGRIKAIGFARDAGSLAARTGPPTKASDGVPLIGVGQCRLNSSVWAFWIPRTAEMTTVRSDTAPVEN